MDHAARFSLIIFAVAVTSLAVAASLISGATLGSTLLARKVADNAVPMPLENVRAVGPIGAAPYGVRVISASPYGR